MEWKSVRRADMAKVCIEKYVIYNKKWGNCRPSSMTSFIKQCKCLLLVHASRALSPPRGTQDGSQHGGEPSTSCPSAGTQKDSHGNGA